MAPPTTSNSLTPLHIPTSTTQAHLDPQQPLTPKCPSTFNTRDLGLHPASPLRPGWLYPYCW